MDFSSLLSEYLSRHWRSMSDDIRQHLQGFAAHCEGAAADLAERAESAAHAVIGKVAETIAPPAAPVVEAASEAAPEEVAPAAAEPAAETPADPDLYKAPLPADPADDQPAAA